jgi:RNA polymerase primary sigma factor
MLDALGDRESSTLRAYFDDIADSEPLSREREVELSARIQDGDQDARDELIQANLRFVIDVAKNYQNRGLSFPDLISAGNLGLMTAAERFDGTRGYKFISYAVWWIRQSILQTIAEHVRTVRLPLNKLSLLKDISKATRKLGHGRDHEPVVEEIAKELDLSPDVVTDAILSARPVSSLDGAFDDDEKRSLLNIVPDQNQRAPDSELMRGSARGQLEDVLNSLDEREQKIIRLYFGLDGMEALTLEQIGDLIGVTRERVRQIKERALGRLRHPSRYQFLKQIAESVEETADA